MRTSIAILKSKRLCLLQGPRPTKHVGHSLLTYAILSIAICAAATRSVDAQTRNPPLASANRSVAVRTGRTAAPPPPVITLVNPTKIYNSGELVELNIIGGAGGGIESSLAAASISIPQDGRHSVGNVRTVGLYTLRYLGPAGSNKLDFAIKILPASGNRFTVELIGQITATLVPVNNPNALTKFWGLVDEVRIKKAWNDAFPNWLATQGPGAAAIGITCAATIPISGGGVLAICIKEGAGVTVNLIAALFEKLADNLKADGALTASEATTVKVAVAGLNSAAGLFLSNKEKFDKVIAALRFLNEVLLAENNQLRVLFSLVLDGTSKANFMIDVSRRLP